MRTLRDLGVNLATIRQVVDREISLPEVAAAHAEALTVQIRVLRLRRAVLMTVAKRGSAPEEMNLMHKPAKLSDDERRRLIDDFLGAAFGGLDAHPEFAGIMRSMPLELPDNPEAHQVEACVELAELSKRRLLIRLEIANVPRRERYLQLLAVVNGWQAPESLTPALDWFIQALRTRTVS